MKRLGNLPSFCMIDFVKIIKAHILMYADVSNLFQFLVMLEK